MFKKGYTPWNKGQKGITGIWNKGRKLSNEHKNKLSKIAKQHQFGKDRKNKPKPKNAYSFPNGKNHPLWKEGRSNDRNYRNQYRINLRHKLGISKKYNLGLSHTKEYKKMTRQKRKAFMKGGGKLSIQTIQQVYEDNIKRFGTLTCYLCLQPIPFGKDHLEHKTPLIRGGTNEYNNLAIACQHCNCKKHTKTEVEYRKERTNV